LENYGETFSLSKLRSYGVEVQLITWIQSFISGRNFRVTIDGVASELSLTRFLIYINDLLDTTTNPIRCFADDSTL
jgi:hypothetical protein